MKKISRKGFLKVAAAAAMSGVTASALAACNAGSSSSTAATGEAIYTPGTSTGNASGIGEGKGTLTFSETAITDVVIDASNETESIGGVAAPTLKDALMAAQSTEIDNISGATITTNAVKKAAASCSEQAMGVHTAGGHGVDDFNVCQKYPQVPITVPVDDGGYLTDLAGKYAGQRVWAAIRPSWPTSPRPVPSWARCTSSISTRTAGAAITPSSSVPLSSGSARSQSSVRMSTRPLIPSHGCRIGVTTA